MTQSAPAAPTPSAPTPASFPHDAVPMAGTAALALGLAVGALTSYGQTLLGGTFLAPLANSVSAWLIVPFIVGTWMRSPAAAAAAGLSACAVQVIGYDLTAELRGFSSPLFWTLFWIAGAVIGGPLLGQAGHAWRKATRTQAEGVAPSSAAAGASSEPWGSGAGVILPAAFLTEGLVAYGLRLGYWDQAVLFLLIGGALAWWFTRSRPADLRWLAVAIPCGILGQLALGAITSMPFTW